MNTPGAKPSSSKIRPDEKEALFTISLLAYEATIAIVSGDICNEQAGSRRQEPLSIPIPSPFHGDPPPPVATATSATCTLCATPLKTT
ncbi:hypothetical protein L1887_32224 [Cichorium endivia]|nr:hypothetical protein L1887_32224 [Cichorium endivia]